MKVEPIDNWGNKPLYLAKVGSGPSDLIMVKRVRDFFVGQHILFARIDDVRGMCIGCTPNWSHGLIWKIEDDRLFVER